MIWTRHRRRPLWSWPRRTDAGHIASRPSAPAALPTRSTDRRETAAGWYPLVRVLRTGTPTSYSATTTQPPSTAVCCRAPPSRAGVVGWGSAAGEAGRSDWTKASRPGRGLTADSWRRWSDRRAATAATVTCGRGGTSTDSRWRSTVRRRGTTRRLDHQRRTVTTDWRCPWTTRHR